jgi:hypothetical protein
MTPSAAIIPSTAPTIAPISNIVLVFMIGTFPLRFEFQLLASAAEGNHMLMTVLLVILILVVLGGIGPWAPYGYGYGYGHVGVGLPLILVIVLIVVLLGGRL